MLAFFNERAYERRMRLTNASSSVHRLWDHSSKITDSFSNNTLLALHVSQRCKAVPLWLHLEVFVLEEQKQTK